MSASAETHRDVSLDRPEAVPWNLASRLAFRFCVIYFGLFCLLTQFPGGLIPIPGLEIPDLSTLPPFRQMVLWTASHLFRYKQPVIFSGSGSGDKVFDWVLSFCLLILALAATCIWSVLDRRRNSYNFLYKWFRVFIRFALAGQLFVYGLVKIFPMQMPFPYLTQLLEPFGHLSPMGVLWSSIGASPAYERFAGSAELLAGLLLIFPPTSMLGALICLADMIEVFVLNMTYDVPVKLFSFHLMLMALFLLIPNRSRLVRFCWPDCAIASSTKERFHASIRGHRIATAAQVLFGLLMLGATFYGTLQGWSKYGGGAPKSPLYGIWNVDKMTIDGAVRAPLLTDHDRWRRVIFDFPQWMDFERMDDSFDGFSAKLDSKENELKLTDHGDKNWKGQLAVHRQSADRMTLGGRMGQHSISVQLNLMDRNKLVLVSRGFHWIQDYPYNH